MNRSNANTWTRPKKMHCEPKMKEIRKKLLFVPNLLQTMSNVREENSGLLSIQGHVLDL